MSTGKSENMRNSLCLNSRFISPNRCFHLFKLNVLINTFIDEKITDRCYIKKLKMPFVWYLCKCSDAMAVSLICVYMDVCTCVWPSMSMCMVCLWRYLWPICTFVLSYSPITFLRWSMRLINVLCRGFPFTQGTPHGLFTYMSYWQHIPFPLVTSEQINTLTSGCIKAQLGNYVELALAMS